MSKTVKIDFPDNVFPALRQDTEGFSRELRVAAAVKWYELGVVSQERAADIAGLSREEFILALSRFKVSPFQVDQENLHD
jgi:predicted HTH domain antitoxin